MQHMSNESFEKDPLTGNRKVTVSVQVAPETLEVIDQLAADQQRSRSNMVSLIIALGLVAHASNRGSL
jgi:hypothetical protein